VRTTTGPPRITVLEVGPGRAVTVFRIVRSDNRDDPVLLNSFRSNYELGDEPRKVERSSAVIHMGISSYVDEGVARGTAQRWPKLGDFVAEVRLRPDQGFNFAHTGHPLHLTVWGDPVKLKDAVVDIQSVED
jgi:hypothetical protein